MTTPANPADQQGSRPVPDPTILTTEALLREITHLRELLESKLDSVHNRLESAEEQRREQKFDTGKAIDAALMAQREAANKSEAAIDKRIEQMQSTFKTDVSNLTLNLSDIKDRVGKIEAVKIGGSESRAGLYATIGVVATIILAVLAVIAYSA